MSPAGGVGISEAIQDAVVASNVLGPRLRAGHVRVSDLAAVQRRREWPVRIVQGYQRLVQASLMATSAGVAAGRVPLGVRVQAHTPIVRDVAARIFGLGVWPARLRATVTPGQVELAELSAAT